MELTAFSWRSGRAIATF